MPYDRRPSPTPVARSDQAGRTAGRATPRRPAAPGEALGASPRRDRRRTTAGSQPQAQPRDGAPATADRSRAPAATAADGAPSSRGRGESPARRTDGRRSRPPRRDPRLRRVVDGERPRRYDSRATAGGGATACHRGVSSAEDRRTDPLRRGQGGTWPAGATSTGRAGAVGARDLDRRRSAAVGGAQGHRARPTCGADAGPAKTRSATQVAGARSRGRRRAGARRAGSAGRQVPGASGDGRRCAGPRTLRRRPADGPARAARPARHRRSATRSPGWPCTAPASGARPPPSWKSPAQLDRTLNHHAVLADCYRALKRYDLVEQLWRELREGSPSPALMAEGRIVAAGALADQGDLKGALKLMERAADVPKKVRDHHLRQWYVLGDLHDRSGDIIKARALLRNDRRDRRRLRRRRRSVAQPRAIARRAAPRHSVTPRCYGAATASPELLESSRRRRCIGGRRS